MRPTEARHIAEVLSPFAGDAISPCLNIGSSTGHFRTIEQPHVDSHLFRPLRQAGVQVYHLDAKDNEGVDLVGDVMEPSFQARLAALQPRLVMCCNLLEHLTDPVGFAGACAAIVRPSGFLLVSGPYSYPYHLDPIDTLYRPAPEDICALFPGFVCLHKAIVSDSTYLDDLLSQNSPRQLTRLIGGHILAFPYLLAADRERFKARYHRYLWLLRPYKSAVVLLRRAAPAARSGTASRKTGEPVMQG